MPGNLVSGRRYFTRSTSSNPSSSGLAQPHHEELALFGGWRLKDWEGRRWGGCWAVGKTRSPALLVSNSI